MQREVNIVHNAASVPQTWQVEDLNSDGDGGIDVAVFSGPYAESRARRYADRLQSHTD